MLALAACLLLAACATNEPDDDAPLPTLFVLESPVPPVESTPEVTGESTAPALDSAGPTRVPALVSWQPAQGTLDGTGANMWQFFGQAGDAIRLRAIGRDVDVTMTLLAPDGAVLGEGDTIEATLPTSDVYRVEVASVLPGGIGTYDLGLGYTDRPNPTDAADIPAPALVGVPTPTPAYAGSGTFVDRLTGGETLGGDLDDAEDAHIYTFDGESGQYVEIALVRVSGALDPRLTVFDPAGSALALDDNSGGERDALLRNLRLPADGLYSVQVTGGGFTGSYALRLIAYADPAPLVPTTQPTPTATPTFDPATPTIGPAVPGARLRDHVPVTDALTAPDGVNIYSFELPAGVLLTVGVNPAPGSALRPQLEIVDPDGALVGGEPVVAAGSGLPALLLPTPATLGGVYQLFVTAEDNTTGGYTVSFGTGTTRGEVQRGLIPADAQTQASIDAPAVRDVWTLYLSAGDIISAAAQPTGSSLLDPVLDLVAVDADPNDPGAVLAVDDNGGGGSNALLNSLRIPATGVYHLRVRAAGAATTGAYTLVWRYVNRAPTATPIPAVALVMTVDDVVGGGLYGFYPFQGRAGTQVRVRVIGQPGSGFDPVAALVAPDGSVIAEADDTEGDLNARFIVALPEDGTYQVRVNGYRDGGPFTLFVEEVLR